ncbi:MAG: NifB/NifX family molybdenum-iron cluster-binding protein [Lutibacter sp.]|nr:NifB/NifX family molybdenum-iron cluster-binding protein [Lutibacter sp.]MBP9601503.1 NifB/NifX family molybdenum-iron cluster-binding protein [Lutibacter sp.]
MKKIAIPVDINNELEDHFGHCDHYEIYTISDNKIVAIEPLIAEQGCGCKSNIASVLAEHGVTVMLAGGIGGGAINVLNKCNIEVIRGCSGDINDLIHSYIAGKVVDSGESCESHAHEHGEGHECSHS